MPIATADFNQGQTKATTNVGGICPTFGQAL